MKHKFYRIQTTTHNINTDTQQFTNNKKQVKIRTSYNTHKNPHKINTTHTAEHTTHTAEHTAEHTTHTAEHTTHTAEQTTHTAEHTTISATFSTFSKPRNAEQKRRI